MTKKIEQNLEKIPIINWVVQLGKKIKIPGLEGMSLYDVVEMYFIGIVRGALTTRAGGINNQYGGLLSLGFLLSMFLMTNGVNSIFGNFEHSYHIKEHRSVIKAYVISLGVSLLMSAFLIITVTLIILYQVALAKIDKIGWIDTGDLNLFYYGRALLFLIMIFTVVSLLFRYGTTQGREIKFFSAGAVLTTVLTLFFFYLFGIYVVKFATYNQLYGSIGTLLILMLFVWLNAIILLLGFELNASISRLKRIKKTL